MKIESCKKKDYSGIFPVSEGKRKKFEIRKDEDDIQVGDLIVLEEWNGEYTGQALRRYVKYVLRGVPEYGLMDGYCIIGW